MRHLLPLLAAACCAALARGQSASGTLRTLAGTGTQSFSGDGGPATSAALNMARSMLRVPSTSTDTGVAGSVIITDMGNRRVRMIANTTGIISTILGAGGNVFNWVAGMSGTAMNLGSPRGCALGGVNLFVTDDQLNRVFALNLNSRVVSLLAGSDYTGSTSSALPATSTRLNGPAGVAVDAAGAFVYM